MARPPRTRTSGAPVPVPAPNGAQTVIQQFRQGPLPAPQELLQYDQLLPGSADRIIAMAEREQAHRINVEDLAHRAEIRHRDEIVGSQREVARAAFTSDLIGQILGWVIAAGCVAGAVYTAYIHANPWVSIALVSLPVASIIKAVRSMLPDGGAKKPPAK